MGSDRYMENRFIAEENFWRARALLVRVVALLESEARDAAEGERLYLEIKSLLKRTEVT